jgi:hypothetical protein
MSAQKLFRKIPPAAIFETGKPCRHWPKPGKNGCAAKRDSVDGFEASG